MSREDLKKRLKVVEQEVKDIKEKLEQSMYDRIIHRYYTLRKENIEPTYLFITSAALRELPNYRPIGACLTAHEYYLSRRFMEMEIIELPRLTEDFIIGV